MVNIDYFLDKMRPYRGLGEKLDAYFEVQRQLVWQDIHLAALNNVGIRVTPERITELSEYSDFKLFVESNGITMDDYMPLFKRSLEERLRKDKLARLLLQ